MAGVIQSPPVRGKGRAHWSSGYRGYNLLLLYRRTTGNTMEVCVSTLPTSPNLEQLKKQAKDLLKAYRLGDPKSMARVHTCLASSNAPASPLTEGRVLRLSDTLLVLAREYGFPSWPRLKATVEAALHDKEAGRMTAGALPSIERELSHAAGLSRSCRRRSRSWLAARFALMPLRDIVSVRASLLENGQYPSLVDALIEGLEQCEPTGTLQLRWGDGSPGGQSLRRAATAPAK